MKEFVIFDRKFGFYMPKSSPGTPPDVWKLTSKNYDFSNCLLNFDVVFGGFLAVILVPELSRKVRETRGIHFHQFSSIYVLAEPSNDDLTDFYRFLVETLSGKLMDNCQKNKPKQSKTPP